ncbi:MAG: PEGA domain-containing protein [Ignavibacteriales bacterium]|nr:PEGA domain-containing protein [Ignavibacteriales bacterium]
MKKVYRLFFPLISLLLIVHLFALAQEISPPVKITSNPIGSHIFSDTTYLGSTPLTLSLKENQPRIPISIFPSSIRLWDVSPLFDTIGSLSGKNNFHFDFKTEQPKTPRTFAIVKESDHKSLTPHIAVAAGTVLFTATAAYSKIYSDKLYRQYLDEYSSTGKLNAQKRNNIRRYDTISAVALIAAEVGFLYLSISLLNY